MRDGPLVERLKWMLVRSPCERPARALRAVWALRRLVRHPELHAVLVEDRILDRLLERVVEPDSRCVDVGCHLGGTLSRLLSLAPRGSHAAFEPIPYKAAWLRRKFPEVEVHEAAVGAAAGPVEFYVQEARSGFSGIRLHDPEGRVHTLRVPCVRLDDALDPGRRVDLLKLDVEGGELAALRGAEALVRRWRPRILFECTESGLSAHGVTAAEVHAWLTSHGYEVYLPAEYLAGREPLSLERFAAAQRYPFQAFNFFAEARGEERGAGPAA
jgi:FkbM family methyltransferase